MANIPPERFSDLCKRLRLTMKIKSRRVESYTYNDESRSDFISVVNVFSQVTRRGADFAVWYDSDRLPTLIGTMRTVRRDCIDLADSSAEGLASSEYEDEPHCEDMWRDAERNAKNARHLFAEHYDDFLRARQSLSRFPNETCARQSKYYPYPSCKLPVIARCSGCGEFLCAIHMKASSEHSCVETS